MTEPRFFTVSTSDDYDRMVQAYVRVFGEDGALLALSEKALTRPYAPTYEWIPQRLPREGEKIICHAWFENVRGQWADVLCAGGAIQIISRRVYDTLESERVKSYRVLPMKPAPNRSGLRKGKEMPDYVAIILAPGLEVEWEGFDVTPKRDRRLAHSNRKLKRWIPKEDTWKGFDLFRTSVGQTCCTRRIVELAREHRWTNFEFKPLDVRRDMPSEGIDYLGEKWPPESWYPPSPSEGKTVEQWVDAYMVHARNAYERAQNPQPAAQATRLSAKAREKAWNERMRPNYAIMYDLATEAVPLFVHIVRQGDERDRGIAAHMLLTLAQHTRIDTDILAELVLPICERSLRRGEKGFGQSTIVLNSYVKMPKDILDLAHKATGKPPMMLPASLPPTDEE